MGLALAMAAANMVETTLQGFYFQLGFRISLNVKTALIDVLYRKSLRVHSATKGSMGIGAIVNLQSNDAAKLWNMPPYFHGLWTAPIQVNQAVLTHIPPPPFPALHTPPPPGGSSPPHPRLSRLFPTCFNALLPQQGRGLIMQ